MSRNSKLTYEISLKNLTQSGITCKDISIEWEKPSCGEISCNYDNKDTIRVTFDEDCKGQCIYAVVRCNDANLCSTCPSSERIKICPCTVNGDCGDCEECISDLCISKCKEEQVCVNETCVGCSDEVPCPKNQVCVNGECQCPPSKPFKNDKGECVDCKENSDCPPCHICTPNGCVPIDCVEGACDPETGNCVGCLNSGDCKKANECCVGKSCDCCPGFVRDLVTGECIEEPQCSIDKDCKECEVCVDGICLPIECPEGYICVGGECKPICECTESKCSESAACVNLNETECYCNECDGDCSTNENCGPGCYCLNGKCTPKPCKGSCENGGDCGEGCGCKNGECTPCDSLDCATSECTTVLGCECTGNGCSDITGCSGECSSSHDCGEGCTCFEGECVPCGDFPCNPNDCDAKPGCKCEGGNCGGDGQNGCSDKFDLIKKNEVCDLEANLTMDESCSCSKLTFTTDLISVTTYDQGFNLDFKVWLRKGQGVSLAQANTLPHVKDYTNENIADNEDPISGTVRMLVQPFYDEYAYKLVGGVQQLVKINSNVPGQIDITTANFSGKSAISFNGIEFIHIGEHESEFLIVTKVKATIQQSTDFVFPNGCTYKSVETIDTFVVNNAKSAILDQIKAGVSSLGSYFEDFKVISSSDTRNPLFTWFKSDDDIYTESDIMRKVYIPKDGSGAYIDTLFGPIDFEKGKFPLVPEEGLLRSGRYYAVKNDCSCDKDEELGRLVFCNPTKLFYELSECNTKLKIKEPFQPCSVNQDLTKFGINDPQSQVKYALYLNGNLWATYVDSIYGMVTDDAGIQSMFDESTYNEPITNITLKMNHDDKGECELSYDIPSVSDFDIQYAKNCNIAGNTYVITIPKIGTGYVIDTLDVVNGSVTSDATNFTVIATKGESVTMIAHFNNGCQKELILIDDCCEEFKVGFVRDGLNTDKDLKLDTTITGGGASYTITYTGPGFGTLTLAYGAEVTNTAGSGVTVTHADNSEIRVSNYQDGTYTITVEDNNGCKKTEKIIIDRAKDPKVTFSNYNDICEGDVTEILVTGDAATLNSVITYTRDGVASSLTLDGFGSHTISGINNTSEFVFQYITIGGVVYIIGKTINITKAPILTASIGTSDNYICDGETTDLTLTGTPNATVTVNNYGAVVLDNSGAASVSVAPLVTTTYSATNVTLGSCSKVVSSDVLITRGNSSLTVTQVQINGSGVNCGIQLSIVATEAITVLPVQDNLVGNVYVWNSLPNGSTINITTAGTCALSEVYNVNCDCPVVPNPTGPTNVEYCAEDTNITLTVGLASGLTLEWENASTFNNRVVTQGVYTAYAVNANGCKSTGLNITVVENPTPIVNTFSIGSPNICVDGTLSWNSTSTIASGLATATLEVNGTNYGTGLNGNVVHNLGLGNYTGNLTIVDTKGCTVVASDTFDVINCCDCNAVGTCKNTCEIFTDLDATITQGDLNQTTVTLVVDGNTYTTSNLGAKNVVISGGNSFLTNFADWLNGLNVCGFAAFPGTTIGLSTNVLTGFTYPNMIDWTLDITFAGVGQPQNLSFVAGTNTFTQVGTNSNLSTC